MGKNRKKKQGCEYSKLNPNASEFVPAVVTSCEGISSSYRHASLQKEYGEIPKSSRPRPYSNNSDDKLCFSFLETHGEISEDQRVDFVSELPTLIVQKILQHLDVTSIQNCRKVCHTWNEVIIELQPNVIKDIERDEAFIRRLIDSRLSEELPEEPYYQDRKCATCAIDDNYCDNMWALKHDLVKLITYHYDCEDKSRKHDCPYCPDWYVKDGDYGDEEEEESDDDDYTVVWDSQEEDYIRSTPAPPKPTGPLKRCLRSLWSHFSHIVCKRHKEVYQFLLKEQRLYPPPCQ